MSEKTNSQMVILAAGEGRRLRPYTEHKPKVLLNVAGRTILEWQVIASVEKGINSIAVVTGYLADQFQHFKLKFPDCKWYNNANYLATNMVESLWCADSVFSISDPFSVEGHHDVIVSYGDIVYQDVVLEHLIASDAMISVVVDVGWRGYWESRFDDPLSDAESLKFDHNLNITEIGNQSYDIDEIQGQYIGLMKFRDSGIDVLKNCYEELSARFGSDVDGFRKIYMTDLLQAIIESGHKVSAVLINRGWLEIDSVSDYKLAERLAFTKFDKLTISE